MTTEHATPRPPDRGRRGLFPTVIWGYHKRTVEDHVAGLRERIAALEAELEGVRRRLTSMDDQAVAPQFQPFPRHERVSLRLTQILRLADEEAQQARDQAAQHAAALLAQAQTEARGLIEAAHSTAEEVLRATLRRCDEQLAEARAEADRLIQSARHKTGAVCAEHPDVSRRVRDADEK